MNVKQADRMSEAVEEPRRNAAPTAWEKFKDRVAMGFYIAYGTVLALVFLWLMIKIVKFLFHVVAAI